MVLAGDLLIEPYYLNTSTEEKLMKKFVVISLLALLTGLAVAPETYADNRCNGNRFGVRGRTYYNGGYRAARSDRGRRYGVLGRTYYDGQQFHNGRRVFNNGYRDRFDGRRFDSDRRGRRGRSSTGRAALSVGAPAAIGAGVGALLGGWKGAGIGALIGGGGGAAVYLLKNRKNNRRFRR